MELTLSLPEDNISFDLCEKMFEENHVLIAGCTGSGKSVLIGNFIHHIIGCRFPFDADPNGVRFILIDPKRVDLVEYKGVPHVKRYEYEYEAIRRTLDDVIEAMELRYKYMQSKRLKKYDKGHMIVIIDELADLITMHAREILPRLQRIVQLGRAAKIHLICATQAPARKVIPAELTLNFTGLIGLHCRSAIESNQIIGMDGAEKLPQNGKCIFVRGGGDVEYCDVKMLSSDKYKRMIEYWENQMGGKVLYKSYSEGTLNIKKEEIPEAKESIKTEKAKTKSASKAFSDAAKDYREFCDALNTFAKIIIPCVIVLYILFKYYFG